MSDPNGLVYYNGKYHLFYQYNPSGVYWGNMSWGHAVSFDLVNWEEKPVAIPVQNGVMAFSGSIVVDWNNTSGFGINGQPPLIAIYTGATNSIQDQRIAYSNDEGLTWTSYSQNPVIKSTNNQFRDPKVTWHKESQKWIMVVSLGFNNKIRFYSSPDLKNWTYLEDFGSFGNVSGVWECPDLFKLPIDNDTNNTKWVLVHSVAAQSRAQYFIGDFDGEHFTWESKTPNGNVIDDFERGNYNDWIVTGTAFGSEPATGNIENQKTVSGYLGNKLINSYNGGNVAVGKLVSPDFSIEKNYIGFLIGGGELMNGAYIKLVVNGETVRTSTGKGDDFMKWRNWDVSGFVGQTAHLEVVDSVTGIWGHILIDHIIQSDVMIDHINNGQLDYGEDFYAAQSFSDVLDGRRIWLGWLNNWNYAANIPTMPWKGIMSIPRELKLETHNGQLKLVQVPANELRNLRKDSLAFSNTNLSVINNSLRNVIGNSLYNPTFKQFGLNATVAVTNEEGFSIKFKKNGVQYSEFVFDFINKEIRFNRSRSGKLTDNGMFRRVQTAPLIVENGFINFELIVDNCSAELFSGSGQIVISNQIFPDSTSNRIELTALNEDIIFEKFNVWKIEKKVPLPATSPIVKKIIFQFYPNPIVNSNGLTIKVRDELAGRILFKIFNSSGMLISEFQPSSNSLIVPENRLPSSKGLYYVTGSDGIITQTEKLIVLGH